MRTRGLEIQAFRGWREPASLDLSAPITLLVGDNRSGKSSATNAVEWCLYGPEVEKQSPGLEERADWEVRPRDAGDVDTVVTLVLDDDAGRVEITRRRPAQAKGRNPDRLTVRREGEAPLEGDAAGDWLHASGLPSWEDYRRAHCFHQEAARTRVIEKRDRSSVLRSLLGLEEDMRVRASIDAQTGRKSLLKEVDDILASLEQSIRDRLARPERELLDVERALAARGIDRKALGSELLDATRRGLVDDARSLAGRLGMEVALPEHADAAALSNWASTWSSTARSSAPALARLPDLRRARGKLATAKNMAQPAQGAWREARDRLARETSEHGDADKRTARLREAEAVRTKADRERKRIDGLTALLKDARALVPPGEDASACPVCRTEVGGLAERIDDTLAGLATAEATQAAEALRGAELAVRRARDATQALEGLQRGEQAARSAHDAQHKTLAGLLEVESAEDDQDLVAAAAARLEEIDREGKSLAALEGARDEALTRHGQQRDLLLELERWETLRQAAERVVDLDALAALPALDLAVDEAAAFTADLEALAGMAREAEEARSASRETDVNEHLSAYYALISEDTSTVRVDVHRTAKQVSYRLVDATDRPAIPILNQASLNALSLAMLFAQAETRARAGGPDFVVLDDPVQSLDGAHQQGLAKAIQRLAETCAVVVAATPSELVEHLHDKVGTAKRTHHLAPWDDNRGSRIERTEGP